MQFSGYDTCGAIMKLRAKEKRTKMFDFVKSMSDGVEDKNEMFGIFKANPEKYYNLTYNLRWKMK